MPELYKALIVVIVITTTMFLLAKPIFTAHMSAADFVGRRNAWLGVTLAGFLTPSFWLYVFVASLIILYTASRDSNPVALYIFLLLAMPPIGAYVPTFGIVNQLFFLEHLRLMSLLILVPMAFGAFARPSNQALASTLTNTMPKGVRVADMFMLGYVLLQIALLMPYEAPTNTLRRVILLGTDIMLPYFVVSRRCRDFAAVRETMAAFVLAAFVLAPIGVFESLRGWLMYAGLESHWGIDHFLGLLRRGDTLRAQTTSGHSIVFGFTLAFAIGFWLYLQTWVAARYQRWVVLLALLAGLVVTYARGPWLGATVIWVGMLALGQRPGKQIVKASASLLVIVVLGVLSPWGSKMADNLPFIGSAGQETIDYRAQLAEMSWRLIQQHPWFGSRDFLTYMEDLRQGEGIIDMVNAYAGIGLNYGLVGMTLFAGFFLAIIVSAYRWISRLRSIDADLSFAGAALLVCLVSGLIMLGTVNLYLSINYFVWGGAGLLAAYVGAVERLAGADGARMLQAPAGELAGQAAGTRRW